MRWKMLPESLGPAERQLVAELRLLKDRSGLSLMSLGARTPFSVSSWERYLNGGAVPPTTAVVAFARLAGADAAPLLALRDAAQRSRATPKTVLDNSGPARALDDTDPARAVDEPDPARAAAADVEHPAPGPSASGGRVRVVALSTAVGAVLLSAAVSVWLIRAPASGTPRGTATGGGAGAYTCSYSRHGDLVFAGNSTTTTRLVSLNTTGPEAAEVQCLLLRHRLSPGDVDGYYGDRTAAQVERLQRENHVPADRIVGEQTWALLRHVE
ncbi:helix-turn-helix domain-containing protein [Streptomyces griseoviridis]|uniref:Peptidoglycan-binding protein n=1 Tax=Streptomyces griseoviridis TaxID=45398 RepID=A0A3Q9KR49_STRGD|nr:helix-turn-helix domain-containing protein [Streptomyces griseoviridis]AZS84194.1 peptidoglycan-binding protein [Streptomyces griseoviridis]QCN88947.1 peptidoglycan-binding protein [Streptomyces griseoviridis]